MAVNDIDKARRSENFVHFVGHQLRLSGTSNCGYYKLQLSEEHNYYNLFFFAFSFPDNKRPNQIIIPINNEDKKS